MAEWLRRWTANPMCSARVGSNPILVDFLAFQPPNNGLSLFFFSFSRGILSFLIILSFYLLNSKNYAKRLTSHEGKILEMMPQKGERTDYFKFYSSHEDSEQN